MDVWPMVKQIWTIARHTIVQAMRMRVVLIVIAFVAVLLLSMPFVLESDNTREGQCRMVITYSVWLIAFLLSVLTLFLPAAVLWAEIKGQQILLLDPKPMVLGRGTLLLGKWLGIMLINSVLLGAMMLMSFLLVVLVVGRQMPNEPDAAYDGFRTRMFLARDVARPEPPRNLSGRVEEAIKALKEKDLMPRNQSEEWVRNLLYERLLKGAWSVATASRQEWIIGGVPKDEGWLMVQFRHYGPPDRQRYDIPGRFVVNGDGQPVVRIPVLSPDGRRRDERDIWLQGRLVRRFRAGKPETFFVRSTVVREDNTVQIEYFNHDRNNVTAQFPYVGGIEILYPAASLGENFIRTGLVILCHLAFLAMVGIFASTFLGFPVAVLVSMTVYVVGLMRFLLFSEMLPKLFLFGTRNQPPWAEINKLDRLVRNTITGLFSVFPNLLPSGVVDALSNGQYIATMHIAATFFWIPLLRGGLLAFLAWAIFRRRQLAILSPNA